MDVDRDIFLERQFPVFIIILVVRVPAPIMHRQKICEGDAGVAAGMLVIVLKQCWELEQLQHRPAAEQHH